MTSIAGALKIASKMHDQASHLVSILECLLLSRVDEGSAMRSDNLRLFVHESAQGLAIELAMVCRPGFDQETVLAKSVETVALMAHAIKDTIKRQPIDL